MKTMEQLEKAYMKELELSEKHKKAAMDIKKQMELQQGKAITQRINAMNMNGAEYDRFMRLLAGGKKSVMEAAELVLKESEKGGEKLETKPRPQEIE
ncbi:MAG: hypothetical protein K2L82_11090 [Lachnospiraceae bacterium]|nr:hypothetical protein [Lachnospiraceae bacterium]